MATPPRRAHVWEEGDGSRIGQQRHSVADVPVPIRPVPQCALEAQVELKDSPTLSEVHSIELEKLLLALLRAFLDAHSRSLACARGLPCVLCSLQCSYNSQHPIDVGAALTSYHPGSRVGVLSFTMPDYIPADK